MVNLETQQVYAGTKHVKYPVFDAFRKFRGRYG